jgi:rod shape-determining protein MreC
MDGTQTFQVFNRGPSPAARLVFFAVLSLLLMFVDARYRYLESTRSLLSELVSPIQRAAMLPGALWRQTSDFLVNHQSMLEENKALHRQHMADAAQLVQWQAMLQENQHLRNLLSLQQRNQFTGQFAEIIYAERDIFRRKVLVSKGSTSGIQDGEVVMDDKGIVGQITRVYPLLSEVTLITEKDHAVPVQVQRNGLRSIAFGAGDTSHLSLRYMPVSADIIKGDVLVTSGIDGTYPPGIPVARVEEIERDAAYPFARIVCLPIGGVDNHRFWMVLSAAPARPARPEAELPKQKAKKAGVH